MMARLSKIRDGLVNNLRAIGGDLTVLDHKAGNFTAPAIEVGFPGPIDYHKDHGDGTEYTIPIRLYVAQASNEDAEHLLEAYLDEDDPRFVKAAIEAEPTLDGEVHDLIVRVMTGAGYLEHGGIPYLVADWEVTVIT